MEEDEKLEVPECSRCGSKQIRTTKTNRICIRCGGRDELE